MKKLYCKNSNIALSLTEKRLVREQGGAEASRSQAPEAKVDVSDLSQKDTENVAGQRKILNRGKELLNKLQANPEKNAARIQTVNSAVNMLEKSNANASKIRTYQDENAMEEAKSDASALLSSLRRISAPRKSNVSATESNALDQMAAQTNKALGGPSGTANVLRSPSVDTAALEAAAARAQKDTTSRLNLPSSGGTVAPVKAPEKKKA